MKQKKIKIISFKRGLTLLEVVIAVVIMSAAFFPIFGLFSNNTKRQFQLVNLSYANYIGKRIIEKSISLIQATGDFDNLQTNTPLGVALDSKHPVSDFFKDFDLTGINETEYPTLKQELKHYYFTLSLHDVKTMESNPNIKRLEIRVFYENIYNDKKGKVILNMLLSRYKQ